VSIKRLLTVGLVSLSLVVSSCTLIEGEATTTTVDEWTLDAYTDLVAFCQRLFESNAGGCPSVVQTTRDDLNCTVEGAYLLIGQMKTLGSTDSADIEEAIDEFCDDPSTP